MAAARATCDAVGATLGVGANEVLPFSTGVILEHLPVDPLGGGLACREKPRWLRHGWYAACHAIMTTDTLPKSTSAGSLWAARP